jgi:hypothetical protein
MAVWFYGLLHELGHLDSHQKESLSEDHMFSDARVLDATRTAVIRFSSYGDSLKQEAIENSATFFDLTILQRKSGTGELPSWFRQQ